MRFECSYDLEGLGEDANVAIAATDEDVVGPRADTMEIIALSTSALKQTVLVGT